MKTITRKALPAGRLSKDERKRQLLNTIGHMTAANGYAPTMRELARAMDVSLTRVAQLMAACIDDGTVHRHPKSARTIRVTTTTV